MDPPHTRAADDMVLVGVGLLIELPTFERRQVPAKLHQHFAGRRRPAVHGRDSPPHTLRRALQRNRIHQREAGKNRDRGHRAEG